MNFEHTEDRRMLADSLNRFIAQQYAIETRNVVAYGDAGRSSALYAQLAEIGALGALFPESVGGFGGTGFDVSVVFECLGRGLVTEPILGALVVGQALTLAGSDAQKTHLPAIIAGDCIAALAHDEPGSHYELNRVTANARQDGEAWVLNGTKGVVAFGDVADLLLVSMRTGGDALNATGISLFLVSGDVAGLEKRSVNRIEGGRVTDVTFTDVRVGADALVGGAGQGFALLERISSYAVLALAAESVGAMDVAKKQTLEYLRTRKQFGVAIGTFQALQHRMADLLLDIEQARSAVINAAAAVDGADRLKCDKALAAAKYSIGRIGTRVAEECIQLHGGIGMTWELALAHYAKRLVMIDHQFGDEDHHLARYIALSQQS